MLSTQWPAKGLDIAGLRLPKSTSVQLLGSNKKAGFVNKSTGVSLVPPVVSPADFSGKYACVFKIVGGAKAIEK